MCAHALTSFTFLTEKVQISQFLCLHFYSSESRKTFRLCHVCRLWLCHTELADARNATMSFLLLKISASAMRYTLECCGICLEFFPQGWKFQISGLPWTCHWNSQRDQQHLENLESFLLKIVNNRSERLIPVFISWFRCQPTTSVVFNEIFVFSVYEFWPQ